MAPFGLMHLIHITLPRQRLQLKCMELAKSRASLDFSLFQHNFHPLSRSPEVKKKTIIKRRASWKMVRALNQFIKNKRRRASIMNV